MLLHATLVLRRFFFFTKFFLKGHFVTAWPHQTKETFVTPHVVLNPGRNLFQVGSSLLASTGPARILVQHRLPTGSGLPLGISPLQYRILHGFQVDLSSTMDPHGLQMDFLLCHGM